MFNMAAQPCPPERSDIYTHLDGIELPGPVSADQITILIGANVPKAHVRRQVREGPCNLLAFETPFGWTLFGTAPARRSKHTMCTTTSSSIHPMVEKLWEPHKKVFCNLLHRPRDPLEDTLVKFWEQEHTGILPSKFTSMSKDDKRALATLENGTTFDGRKYIVPMLWDDPLCSLPNNYGIALKRFNFIRRRLRANDEMREGYYAKMAHYVNKGFARRMSVEQAKRRPPKAWVLPHHPVFNPNKPGKMRIVNDAAAECQGTSLNKALLTGPDLLNSLVGIILRLRIGRVAVIADLEEFFHHVGVTEENADSLRFLWTDDVFSDDPPYVMQMLVHIFGAKDSANCAIHALHQTARDNCQDFDPLTLLVDLVLILC